MEADWQFHIFEDAPVIDAEWEGSLDLAHEPALAATLPEAQQQPGLAELLRALNRPPLRTSKCDVWTFDDCDPYEFESTAEESLVGTACYIDVLPQQPELASQQQMEPWARAAVDRLKQESFPHARVDFVFRRAAWKQRDGIGITLYAAVCAADTVESTLRLHRLLRTLQAVLPAIGFGTGAESDSSLK